ncbi:7399_t:CDS:2, partial [Cetraspora pellucida]
MHMVSRIESNGFGVYYKGKKISICTFFNHSCDAIQANYGKETQKEQEYQF